MTCKKRVLVAADQIVQSADHDFALIRLVLTFVMILGLPFLVDQFWYRGKLYVFIKITASEPSSVM